jgi:hypothetical protein
MFTGLAAASEPKPASVHRARNGPLSDRANGPMPSVMSRKGGLIPAAAAPQKGRTTKGTLGPVHASLGWGDFADGRAFRRDKVACLPAPATEVHRAGQAPARIGS